MKLALRKPKVHDSQEAQTQTRQEILPVTHEPDHWLTLIQEQIRAEIRQEMSQETPQEMDQEICQEIRQDIRKETCNTNLLQIRHNSVAKSAILKQERKWQHVINKQILKLSLSLETLSQTRTIKIKKPHSIIYKTESTIAVASGIVFTPAMQHSLASKLNKQIKGAALTPATRHSLASNPNKQTLTIALTTATRHSFKPKDFLKILAAIPVCFRSHQADPRTIHSPHQERVEDAQHPVMGHLRPSTSPLPHRVHHLSLSPVPCAAPVPRRK
jgi:hypothetical protein